MTFIWWFLHIFLYIFRDILYIIFYVYLIFFWHLFDISLIFFYIFLFFLILCFWHFLPSSAPAPTQALAGSWDFYWLYYQLDPITFFTHYYTFSEILSQPNNNHNPNNKTTITVVGLRLTNCWEYHPPTHPHKLKTTW